MVGDPSGRSEERNLLTPEQIEVNVAAVRRQMERFLVFDGDTNQLITAVLRRGTVHASQGVVAILKRCYEARVPVVAGVIDPFSAADDIVANIA